MNEAPRNDRPAAGRTPFYQRKEFLPLAVFGGFLAVLLFSTAFSGRPPSISGVIQEDNLAAEIVTITGSNFGAADSGGEVRVGDLALTSANYLKWSNDEIIVSIPREIPSGIIYVVTKAGKCRGDIYMNPDEIPRLTAYTGPLIESISAVNVAPGRLLILKGERFGAVRGAGTVSFSQMIPMGGNGADRGQSELLVSASDENNEFLLWSDREIRVRVPDGAKTGPVMVITDKGRSNHLYLTVMSPVGRREYGSRRSYRLRFGVRVECAAADTPNRLILYAPRPIVCPEQRGIRITRGTDSPAAVPAEGPVGVTLSDLTAGAPETLAIEYEVDCYTVVTEIDPGLIVEYDRSTPFYRTFTGDDPMLTPSHPALAALLRESVGGEKNPYLAARKIYDAVINRFSPAEAPGPVAPLPAAPNWYALEAVKSADAFAYASLFSSLARKAGIPARLVAGYYVSDNRSAIPHYWSEFYLEDFGWVPVDPFLADAEAAGTPSAGNDPRNSRFGALDNRHIAFAKGFRTLQKNDPLARTASRPGVVGLQSFHEEASPSLRRYTAAWDPVTVVDMK